MMENRVTPLYGTPCSSEQVSLATGDGSHVAVPVNTTHADQPSSVASFAHYKVSRHICSVP